MKILVLGGTGFLGPEVVNPLLAAGHTVTLFNRGRTNPTLFPNVEKLVGDRANDLSALDGRSWDAVIDVHASLPNWVKRSADALKGRCRQYVFVSTISVFPDYSKAGMNEDAPRFEAPEELDNDLNLTNESYGPMKTRCEDIVNDRFGAGATIVRPGLIVGPGDATDRFAWWPVRIDRGGDVLVPKPMEGEVQFIDVRDLGEFVARTVMDGHTGTFNATGPDAPLSMAEFLYGCRAITRSPVKFVWADEMWLLENGVQPFAHMPLWAPGDAMIGFMRIDCSKSRSMGLSCRPLAETARDVLLWARERPADYRWRTGLDAATEKRLIDAWRAKQG
jgi:2'-hydroxyisoflavone reductase